MSVEPAKPPRLARGLTALFGEYEVNANSHADPRATERLPPGPRTELPIDRIRPNPGQPRRSFDPADLQELTESIRAKGVLQAILVRPDPETPAHYQIVAGERRWRAAAAAGLHAVPAVIRDDLTELDVLEIAIIENVQRKDLNPVDEAAGYQQLCDRFDHTHAQIAAAVGKSREHISNLLRLLRLPAPVLEMMREGKISAGHGRALLSVPEPEKVAREISKHQLSVREVERMGARAHMAEVVPAIAQLARGAQSADVQALERDLIAALGLKVEIREKAAGGELRIQYQSLEQLDDVCRRLSGSL